jgi:hypothetical protein
VIGRDGTAMPNPIEPGQGRLDNLAAWPPSSVSDEADSARIVLESLVVKTGAPQSGSPNVPRCAASFHGKRH